MMELILERKKFILMVQRHQIQKQVNLFLIFFSGFKIQNNTVNAVA
jgi:hypothetical protein